MSTAAASSRASSFAPAAGLPKTSVQAEKPSAPAAAMSRPWSTTAYSVMPRAASSARSAATTAAGGAFTAIRS